jgi:hypothetical protein
MIDAERLTPRRLLPADRALAVLLGEQGLVVGDRDPVIIFQPGLAPALRVIGALLLVKVGIFRPFAAEIGIDPLLVGGVPSIVIGARPRSILRILGITLLAPLRVRRHADPPRTSL